MNRTLAFIAEHPLTRSNPLPAFARFIGWQLRSRISHEVRVPWIAGTHLIVRRGMTGATGNIYCGLHEFADMALVLHLLRPGDLFVDAGANVGTFTVLAAGVSGAHVLTVEPDPGTMASLRKNVDVNGISERVERAECALGAAPGEIAFTVGLDTTNRVANASDAESRTVPVARLDDLLAGRSPVLAKLDVEGYEAQVLAGAKDMLANPALLAVESEADEPAVADIFAAAGFQRRHYNPFRREFSDTADFAGGNALFVRDEAACLSRIAAAPRRRILGHEI